EVDPLAQLSVALAARGISDAIALITRGDGAVSCWLSPLIATRLIGRARHGRRRETGTSSNAIPGRSARPNRSIRRIRIKRRPIKQITRPEVKAAPHDDRGALPGVVAWPKTPGRPGLAVLVTRLVMAGRVAPEHDVCLLNDLLVLDDIGQIREEKLHWPV